MYRLYSPGRHDRRHDTADQQTGHQTDSEYHQPDFQAVQHLIIQIHLSFLPIHIQHLLWNQSQDRKAIAPGLILRPSSLTISLESLQDPLPGQRFTRKETAAVTYSPELKSGASCPRFPEIVLQRSCWLTQSYRSSTVDDAPPT